MKKYFKLLFGMALVGLLTTACQKGEMLSPAPALTQTTITLMSQNGKSSKPIDIKGKGQNKAPSSNSRSSSNSPNSKSYNIHKKLLSKGGYGPNTYYKEYNNPLKYNNHQKSDERSSDY